MPAADPALDGRPRLADHRDSGTWNDSLGHIPEGGDTAPGSDKYKAAIRELESLVDVISEASTAGDSTGVDNAFAAASAEARMMYWLNWVTVVMELQADSPEAIQEQVSHLMNGGEATLNELRADIESMSVEGQEHALFLLTNHPAAGVRQIGGVIAGAVGRTGSDSRAKSMQAAPSKASAYDDLPPPTVLAAGRAVAANQIQEVDSARFRAYVVRRLTETEYDPSADRGRSLLVPVEVIIDLLVSSLPPGALDVVLGNITSDAARGDRTARYEKQLLDHWAACKMTGRITSLGETVPQRDIDDLLIASKELIPALIGLTAVMAPQRTSIAIDAVKEQAEELNSLATMVQGLMEISFQAMKRDMQRASSSGSGPLGGQSGTPKQPTAQNKSGGCYVATAVYGSYDCPEVWVLRRWRDNHLATTVSGRQFIRLYYRFSPTVVRAFGNERWFSRAVRRPLDRFVDRLRATGYSSLPYSDDESSSRGGPYEVRTPFATRVVAGGR